MRYAFVEFVTMDASVDVTDAIALTNSLTVHIVVAVQCNPIYCNERSYIN